VTLAMSSDLLRDGYDFHLDDDTTHTQLVEPQTASFGLTGYDLTLRLYPTDAEIGAKLAYGKNELTLWVEGDGTKSYSRSTIWLQDFDLQSAALSAFSTDVQQLGGFQGWVGTVTVPVVGATGADGATIMTTDGFRILND
jgi:hypothetical protein